MGKHKSNVQITISLQFNLRQFRKSFLLIHINSISFSIFKHFKPGILILIISQLLVSCSSTKRFTSDEEITEKNIRSAEINTGVIPLRVLLDEKPEAFFITVQSGVYLFSEKNKIAEVNKGNVLECFISDDKVRLQIGRKSYSGKFFMLQPVSGNTLQYNGKSYTGSLQIVGDGNTIELINFVELENYLKGVIAKEMPLGKGNENFEALKAMAVCARTYTIMKMNGNNLLYDIYSDTRDQVYGGINAEQTISSKAVYETRGIILKYDDKPAKIYYHSTCGGVNESVENVFPQPPYPYLISIIDGIQPYCKISSRYEWHETYSEDQFIEQLYNSGVINSINYELEDIDIRSRFESRRVNELQIVLSGDNGRKEIILYGNDIRSSIRTAKKNLMLWSTLFEIERSGSEITLNGKGFGHGVGMCQWGAIGQSRQGRNYKQILSHYFPGTETGRIND
jgi:stage II sporulation protein D